jgi:hypothetical protein
MCQNFSDFDLKTEVEDKQHNAITKWLMSCEVSVLTMI